MFNPDDFDIGKRISLKNLKKYHTLAEFVFSISTLESRKINDLKFNGNVEDIVYLTFNLLDEIYFKFEKVDGNFLFEDKYLLEYLGYDLRYDACIFKVKEIKE